MIACLVCVPGPGWNGCCWRIWGSCVGCPGWDRCKWRVSNPICEVANFACKAVRAIAYVALELAKKIVDGSRWTVQLAKHVLEGVKKVVDKSRATLEVAKGALVVVQHTVRYGLEAAKWIVRLGLGGLINIRKIEFEVKIGLVSSGHFRGSIEISLLGRHYYTTGFNLHLNSIEEMVQDLVKLVRKSIGFRRRREVDERMKSAFPDFSMRHYFPEIYRPGSHRPENAKRSLSDVSASAFDTETLRPLRYQIGSEEETSETGAVSNDTSLNYNATTAFILSAVEENDERYSAVLGVIISLTGMRAKAAIQTRL